MSDHDPFNEPSHAHPRARTLMPEEFFWDCGDEDAPFGSDQGWTSYDEWRGWRERNPQSEITDCLAWIVNDRLDEYDASLYSDARIKQDIESPDDAFMAESYDIFTLDTTMIATGLSQLIDEGKIDATAKPYLLVAVTRQLHPLICMHDERRKILEAVKRVINEA